MGVASRTYERGGKGKSLQANLLAARKRFDTQSGEAPASEEMTGGSLSGPVSASWQGKRRFLMGPPEILVRSCGASLQESVVEHLEHMGAQGCHLIGYASEQTFLGALAFRDPVPVTGSVSVGQACRAAGVQTLVVTADHLQTAVALSLAADLVSSGRAVVGRATEADRQHLAALLVGQQRFVAATAGGGHKRHDVLSGCFEFSESFPSMVHPPDLPRVPPPSPAACDAAFLSQTDVGIALGDSSDAARNAASVVVLQPHLGAVLAALLEGRRVAANVRKAVAYCLGSKAGILGAFLVLTPWAR